MQKYADRRTSLKLYIIYGYIKRFQIRSYQTAFRTI